MIENIIHKSTLEKLLREHSEEAVVLKKVVKKLEKSVKTNKDKKDFIKSAFTFLDCLIGLACCKDLTLLEKKKKALKRMIRCKTKKRKKSNQHHH